MTTTMTQALIQAERRQVTDAAALLAESPTLRETKVGPAPSLRKQRLPLPASRIERTISAAQVTGASYASRAQAAQQLVEQAEEEAQRYSRTAASLGAVLHSATIRRRVAWNHRCPL